MIMQRARGHQLCTCSYPQLVHFKDVLLSLIYWKSNVKHNARQILDNKIDKKKYLAIINKTQTIVHSTCYTRQDQIFNRNESPLILNSYEKQVSQKKRLSTLKSFTMRTLPLCFKFMKIGGLWLPTNCSLVAKFLYNCYSLIIICILYTFTLSEIIDLFVNLGDVEDFTSNSFLLLTMIGICCKATDMMGRRERFKRLISYLFDELCQPCNVDEQKIQKKCAEACRKITRNYAFAILPTVMLLILGPLASGFNNPVLPFRGWQPYSLASRTNFWLTYSHQALAFKVATIISIAYDTLIPVLMIQTCGQLDILKFRLHNLPNAQNYNERLNVMEDHERNHLRMCVCHHNHIIRFSKELQDFFNPVMSLQCFVSLVTLCSNIYLISQFASFSVKFITLLFHFSSLLFQLFIYCWYGNEVILQSSDIGSVIFHIDWLLLRNSTRKDLTIIMLRADMGIKYTCGSIVTMSLGTYMSILKTSYSVFNVLQQS